MPDGDTGTNMARTLDAVVAEIDGGARRAGPDVRRHQPRLADGRPRQQRRDPVADHARASRRRSRGAATPTAAAVADALAAASTAAYQAVLKPVEGTILTVVRESADGGAPAAAAAARWPTCCGRRATPAGESLARTPDLLPVLADAGVVDAGGAGFLLLLDAALHVVDGEPLPEPPTDGRAPSTPVRRRPAASASTASSTSASSATR